MLKQIRMIGMKKAFFLKQYNFYVCLLVKQNKKTFVVVTSFVKQTRYKSSHNYLIYVVLKYIYLSDEYLYKIFIY